MMGPESTGTVFVVGGRGFVGSHVVRALVEAGRHVHLFGPAMEDDRLADLGNHVSETRGSLEDAAAVRTALQHSGAETAISLAAYSRGTEGLLRAGEADAERAFAVNVAGFRHLLEAARYRELRRVLWASSTVVYGRAERYCERPVTEDAERHPESFYGLTKVLAEDVARYYRDRFGLETCALRLPLVFGPGLWYRGAAAGLVHLLERAAPGRELAIEGPAEPFDLMYVKDVAAAFRTLHEFEGALAEHYNVGGFTTTYAEIISSVTEMMPECRIHFSPEHPPFHLPLVDHGRVQHDVGFRPRFGLSAGLRDHFARR